MKTIQIPESTKSRLIDIDNEIKRLQTISANILQTVCEGADIDPKLAQVQPFYASIIERDPAPPVSSPDTTPSPVGTSSEDGTGEDIVELPNA